MDKSNKTTRPSPTHKKIILKIFEIFIDKELLFWYYIGVFLKEQN